MLHTPFDMQQCFFGGGQECVCVCVCVCKVHKRVKIYCHMFLDIQWAIINSSNICNNNSLEVSGNVCVCKVHKRAKIYHHMSLDIQ
jgi:hypothetical protein